MDVERVSTIITLTAGAIFVYAFVLYNKDLLKGKTTPSFVSWLLFSIVTGINFTSFLDMTGDWVKTVCAFADFGGCVLTFGFLMYRRAKGASLDALDTSVLAVCLLAVATWYVFQSSTSANIIVQTCYFLAFLPTIKNTLRDPTSEPAKPWLIWSGAWVLTILVVWLRWEGAWTDMLNPVSLFALHFMCGVFASRRPSVVLA